MSLNVIIGNIYHGNDWQKIRAANKSWVGHNYVSCIYQQNVTSRWTPSSILILDNTDFQSWQIYNDLELTCLIRLYIYDRIWNYMLTMYIPINLYTILIIKAGKFKMICLIR